MKTETNTIIEHLRIVADCTKSEGLSGFTSTILEAADRLEELQRKVRNQRRELEHLKGYK